MEAELRELVFQHLKTFAASQSLEIAWPNKPFVDDDYAAYLEVLVLPVAPDVITVCTGAARFTWLYQINAYVRDGEGEITPAEIVDAWRASLPVGHEFAGTSTRYKVESPARAYPAVPTEGWHYLPADVRLETFH